MFTMHKFCTFNQLATVVALLFEAAAANTSAIAEDLPQTGQFKIIYSATSVPAAKPVALNDTKDVVAITPFMMAFNVSETGLLHRAPGRCAIILTIDKAAKMIEGHGNCTYTDKDGDTVYESFASASPQPMGGGVLYKGSWKGGTGKYASITGEFDIRSSPAVSTEAISQWMGTKVGNYQIGGVAAK